MTIWTKAIAAGMAVLFAAQSACAQDFFMSGTSPMDLAPMTRTITNSAINKHSLDAISRRNAARDRSGVPMSAAAGTPRGILTQAATQPDPGRGPALPFHASAADQQRAKDAFLQRLSAKNPSVVAQARDQMARHDFDRIYAGITRPFGLSPNDAGDVMTAYLVLGWMVANGAPDPSISGVRAARDHVASLLAQGGALADPATRAAVAEELKLLFVIMHSGWQSARREGTLGQYANGVARMFATQNGDDLRRIVLTDGGFRAR